MTPQRAGRLAWSRHVATVWLPWLLLVAYVLLSAIGVALLAHVPAAGFEPQGDSLPLSLTFVAVLTVFALVGAVVASRAPANPIGWLFLALATGQGLYQLSYGIALHGLWVAERPASGTVAWAAWVSECVSPLAPVVLVCVLVLFPTGRPPSRRWRPLLWLCIPMAAVMLLHYGLQPGPFDAFPGVENPVVPADATWVPEVASDPFLLAMLLAAIASLFARHRSAGPSERQQLKWFAYAAGLMAAFLAIGGVATAILGEDAAGTESTVAGYVFAACISGIPVAVGIAILRHGLFDIDLVIRRTLVYGALTATLGASYLGLVLLAGLAVGDSGLAVAASTLAVAALARPALARIQAGVDRRFYRRRYDAARTLEAFGARLRDEVDLEALGRELRGVVGESMQPAHVSLWLRGSRT